MLCPLIAEFKRRVKTTGGGEGVNCDGLGFSGGTAVRLHFGMH
jgi:hypothetical protein